MEELEKLDEKIRNIDITYDYEKTYNELYEACEDFSGFEYLFEDFVTYDYAEELAKYELEQGGLARIYCFLGDVNPMTSDLFRIDGYGNLAEVHKDDLECLRDEILDLIFDKLENLKEETENE